MGCLLELARGVPGRIGNPSLWISCRPVRCAPAAMHAASIGPVRHGCEKPRRFIDTGELGKGGEAGVVCDAWLASIDGPGRPTNAPSQSALWAKQRI